MHTAGFLKHPLSQISPLGSTELPEQAPAEYQRASPARKRGFSQHFDRAAVWHYQSCSWIVPALLILLFFCEEFINTHCCSCSEPGSGFCGLFESKGLRAFPNLHKSRSQPGDSSCRQWLHCSWHSFLCFLYIQNIRIFPTHHWQLPPVVQECGPSPSMQGSAAMCLLRCSPAAKGDVC